MGLFIYFQKYDLSANYFSDCQDNRLKYGEALGWTTGLDRKPLDAKAFYGTITVSTLIGIGINFVGLDPIKALFWSAVINGVVAVPLMVIIMLMAVRQDVMGRFVLPRALWAMGWLCTGTMAIAVGIMFATW